MVERTKDKERLPEELQKKLLEFFLKTSIPRKKAKTDHPEKDSKGVMVILKREFM